MAHRPHAYPSRTIRPALLLALAAVAPAAAQLTGPSSSRSPYLLPVAGGVVTKALITVGDAAAPGEGQSGPYRFVGIPDGMGAYANTDGTFTLLCNHELGSSAGVTRAHGGTGAFVSQWTINPASGQMLTGRDLIGIAHRFDTATGQYNAFPDTFQRFCSGDLPAPTALYNAATGRGTSERIYLTGEETTPNGRAFATVVTGPGAGNSYEVPRLGKMAFENVVASPFAQDKTVIICLDDAGLSTAPTGFPSDLYFYVGTKTDSGSDIERAGLTNGAFYGIQFNVGGTPVVEESNAFGLGTTEYVGAGGFTAIGFGDVSAMNGQAIQTASFAQGVSRLQRIEDGVWDTRPGHENTFYFVTTASFSTNARLWKLTFSDITQPELGGQVEILLRGDEGHRMPDNITMDPFGNIFLQEDPGGVDHLAKIWQYNVESGDLTLLATHAAEYFDPNLLGLGVAGPNFLTRDEESSGIIDARDVIGPGWLIINVQAHYGITGDPELVQGGQLLAMYNPDSFSDCPVDFDHSGRVDGRDVAAFLAALRANRPEADFDRNNLVDIRDFKAFHEAWRLGCN